MGSVVANKNHRKTVELFFDCTLMCFYVFSNSVSIKNKIPLSLIVFVLQQRQCFMTWKTKETKLMVKNYVYYNLV